MHAAANHLTAVELEQGLSDVLASPRDTGQLEAIVIRPASNERERLESAALTPEGGIEGDRWVRESYHKLDDGRPDPCSQVSLMNARFLRQIAGSDEAICLAGDNLVIDMDLSETNLPAGNRLAIGSNVVLEITAKPHTGCSKLASRYGQEAKVFMNDKSRQSLKLRGRYARTIVGGQIAVGDMVRKVEGAAIK